MSGDVVRLRQAPRTDPPLSDEALARGCAGGDPAAIAALFDRFRRPVARYIYRMIGGGPDVDDLVQATFLEIARGQSRYDGERAVVLTWLFAIATNVVRHYRRSVGRRGRLLAAMAEARPPRSKTFDEGVEDRRQLECAQRALTSLSDELREAFVLCELEGLSAKEASDVLGATESAVWKRVSNARKAIRRMVLEAER
jgi:RNA polymerase sigma-70 factor, ECF subfamily